MNKLSLEQITNHRVNPEKGTYLGSYVTAFPKVQNEHGAYLDALFSINMALNDATFPIRSRGFNYNEIDRDEIDEDGTLRMVVDGYIEPPLKDPAEAQKIATAIGELNLERTKELRVPEHLIHQWYPAQVKQ